MLKLLAEKRRPFISTEMLRLDPSKKAAAEKAAENRIAEAQQRMPPGNFYSPRNKNTTFVKRSSAWINQQEMQKLKELRMEKAMLGGNTSWRSLSDWKKWQATERKRNKTFPSRGLGGRSSNGAFLW